MANVTITNLSKGKHIAFKQGTTVAWAFQAKDADGVVIDTTSYKMAGQFRKSYDTAPVFTFTTDDTLEPDTTTLGTLIYVTHDPTQGLFTFTMTPDQTASIVFKVGEASISGIYDLELTDPEGNVSRWLEGTWLLEREITKV